MAELPKLTRWPSTEIEGSLKTELTYVLDSPILPAGLDIEMTASRYAATLKISGNGRRPVGQMLEAVRAVEGWMRSLPLAAHLEAEIARGSHVEKQEGENGKD